MPRLEIHSGARRRMFEVLDAAFSVGSADDCGLRLPGATVRAHHAVLRWDGARLTVHAAGGGDVAVNGASATTAELRHGDRLAIGRHVLVVWLDGKPRPDVSAADVAAALPDGGGVSDGLDLDVDRAARAARRTPHAGTAVSAPRTTGARPMGPASRRRGTVAARPRRERSAGRSRGIPRALLLVNLMLVVGAVGWLGYRVLSDVDVVREPQDSIALAEAQLDAGRYEAALATLRAARARTDDASIRADIDRRIADVDALVQRRRDESVIASGRDEWTRIERVARSWLERRDGGPAAARWVVERVDAWLAANGDVFERYPSTGSILDAARALRESYAAAARLDEPPTAADVLFAAERPLDFRVRRYVESLELLRTWLAAHADAPDADRVRERVVALEQDGPAWVAAEIERIEAMLARGERERARATVRRLLDEAVPEAWAGPVRALAERIGGG